MIPLIVNWGGEVKKVGEAGLLHCPRCGKIVGAEIWRTAKTAGAYYIKIIKWAKAYYLVCPACEAGAPLTEQEVQQFQAEAFHHPPNGVALEMFGFITQRFESWAEGSTSHAAEVESWLDGTRDRLLASRHPVKHVEYVVGFWVFVHREILEPLFEAAAARAAAASGAAETPAIADEAAIRRHMATLGLSLDQSDMASVKAAFRKAALQHHPDRQKDKTPEAQRAAGKRMGEINVAYTELLAWAASQPEQVAQRVSHPEPERSAPPPRSGPRPRPSPSPAATAGGPGRPAKSDARAAPAEQPPIGSPQARSTPAQHGNASTGGGPPPVSKVSPSAAPPTPPRRPPVTAASPRVREETPTTAVASPPPPRQSPPKPVAAQAQERPAHQAGASSGWSPGYLIATVAVCLFLLGLVVLYGPGNSGNAPPAPQPTLEDAEEAVRGNDMERAERILQDLRERTPKDARVWCSLCILRAFQGHRDEAMIYLKRAVALDQRDPEAYLYLAQAHEALDRHAEAVPAFEQAIVGYNHAFALKPNDAKALRDIGLAYSFLNRYSEAIDAYKKAVALTPDDAEAQRGMGIALHEQGRHGEAIEALKKAIALRPKDARAYCEMGLAYGGLNRPDEAIGALRKAIALKPNDAWAHYLIAGAYEYLRQGGDALAAYKECLRLEPDGPNADAARKAIDRMGIGYPSPTSSLEGFGASKDALEQIKVGLAYNAAQKHTDAIEAYKRAIALKPHNALAYLLMGSAYEDLRDFDSALAAYARCSSLEPTGPDGDAARRCINRIRGH